jgi:hypothetical protein
VCGAIRGYNWILYRPRENNMSKAEKESMKKNTT